MRLPRTPNVSRLALAAAWALALPAAPSDPSCSPIQDAPLRAPALDS